MREKNHIHIVVLGGGSGTRFWPVSRRRRPKQLLSFGGRSLLAETFARVAPLAPPARWWLVTGARHADACRAEVPEVPAAQVLVEPQARNTAPAIALAAAHIQAQDPRGILAVLPADHTVADGEALNAALARAAQLAERGSIVTLGVIPTRPEVGYGYIQRGEPESRQLGAFRVVRFCEKPDAARARAFVAQGDFFWNAGIFVLRADRLLTEVDRQLPEVGRGITAVARAVGTPTYERVLGDVYAALPSISIDYGVMERAEEVAVIPVDCGWSDLGSWNGLESVLTADPQGNWIRGRAVLLDSQRCVVHASDGHVIGALGVRDLVIVHTPDATLVVPAERAQDVRAIIEQLKERQWNEYL